MTVVDNFLGGVGARDRLEDGFLAVLVAGADLDGQSWSKFCHAVNREFFESDQAERAIPGGRAYCSGLSWAGANFETKEL